MILPTICVMLMSIVYPICMYQILAPWCVFNAAFLVPGIAVKSLPVVFFNVIDCGW